MELQKELSGSQNYSEHPEEKKKIERVRSHPQPISELLLPLQMIINDPDRNKLLAQYFQNY